MSRPLNRRIWSQVGIVNEQIRVKAILDKTPTPAARLDLAREMLAGCKNQVDPMSLLTQYVLCVSLLVMMRIEGPAKEARELFNLASSILRLQGIDGTESKLSSLVADLNQVMSQIQRRTGEHWHSAWRLEIAKGLVQPESQLSQESWRSELATAIRLLRFGYVVEADQQLQRALAQPLPDRQFVLGWLLRQKIHRLNREFAECRLILSEKIRTVTLTAAEEKDCKFELLLVECEGTSNWRPLTRAVRSGGEFHRADYFLETYLRLSAREDRKAVESLPKVTSVARPRSLHASQEGFLFQACQVIESLWDAPQPLLYKLEMLGDLLGERNHLLTIDKELLVVACARRWAEVNAAAGVAELIRALYRDLVARLTGEPNRDPLGEFDFLDELQNRSA
jgi:hypothetical protein